MEPSHFAAGLGLGGWVFFTVVPVAWQARCPQAGFVAASVVGDDTFGCDPYRVEPSCGSSPEPNCGAYFLI